MGMWKQSLSLLLLAVAAHMLTGKKQKPPGTIE
jgi:hypothetical protein